MSDYMLKRRAIMLGTRESDPKKEPKPIAPISEKKKAKDKAEKPEREAMDKWFKATRKRLVGTCQCGCASPSSKNDDLNYKCSCCHIFPKAQFESVKTHPLNFVERNFWNGCHTNMDNQSMDKWPGMADFDDIKEKFYILAPLLTDEERASKFYSHLERLVYADKPPVNVMLIDPELKTIVVEQIS